MLKKFMVVMDFARSRVLLVLLVGASCSGGDKKEPSGVGGGSASGGSSQAGSASSGGRSGGSTGGNAGSAGDSRAGGAGTSAAGAAGTEAGGSGGENGGRAGDGGIGVAGEGGAAGETSTCENPAPIAIPDAQANATYLPIAVAGSRIGIVHRTTADTKPHLTLYDTLTQTFAPSKLLSVPGIEPRGTGSGTSLTTLPDGHLAAAWTDQDSCYVSLGADTDAPNSFRLSAVVGFFAAVAISPFPGNRVAVAWKEPIPNTTAAYHVVVDIYDPSTTEQRKFIVEAPSRQESAPHLFLIGDRLVVELTQTVPLESGDRVPFRNFFLTTIGEGDVPGMLTATPFVSNSHGSDAPIFSDGTSTRVAYVMGSLKLGELDTNFTLTGTPIDVMAWERDSSNLIFFHDAEGEAVVVAPYSGLTNAVELDENHQPLPASMALISERGTPTGLVRTSAGLFVGWYSGNSPAAAYLTPLCP